MTAITHAPWLKAPETQKLLAALEAARVGGSRFVGGCVRNTLLGRRSMISTSPPNSRPIA
jgi:poly(A) polymerase